MNDIKIKTDQFGYWDIQFQKEDLHVLTEENEVLENGVVLTILTRNTELNPNLSYEDFGSRLYKLIKENNSQLTQSRIRAYIKEAVEDMNRVLKVDNIIFTDDTIEIYITKKDGETLTLGLRGMR